jgi:hypothetical protein
MCSIFQSRLNDALGCQQKNKKSLQELEIKLKVFNNDRSLDFLMQSLKSKRSEEKWNKENHLEDKQQTGKIIYVIKIIIKSYDISIASSTKSDSDSPSRCYATAAIN